MGILFWMLLRSILFSMIGNTFYKWFAGTTWGIWIDYKVQVTLDKVIGKHNEAVAKKSPQIDMFEIEKEPFNRTDGGPSK
jgi:hypothetical protein